MLNGSDGFFNMTYDDLLTASDLGVFPSWYEPWGYTPHESAAYAVPTITTDLSGFGIWVHELSGKVDTQGVSIVPRRMAAATETVQSLRDILLEYASYDLSVLDARRVAARELAAHTSWKAFFPNYIKAYTLALAKSEKRDTLRESARTATAVSRVLTPTTSRVPYLRPLTAVAELPTELKRLREIAHNLWWSTSVRARTMFMAVNPKMWDAFDHNPIKIIENADPKWLKKMATNADYMDLYHRVLDDFDAYMAQPLEDCNEALRVDRPVAYFSTEYGLHESLPIYSGGLGVLSATT